MPELVEKTVKARGLKSGVEFRWRSKWWRIDEIPTTKTRYTYVDVGHEDPFRIPADADVRIRVLLPTKQERYEEVLEFVADLARTKLLGYRDEWADELKSYRGSSNPDAHDFTRVTIAKARLKTWANIERIMWAKDGHFEGMTIHQVMERAENYDIIDAVREHMSEVFREVWANGRWGVTTDPMSNAVKQIEINYGREWHDEWMMNLSGLDALKKEIG